MQSLGLTLAMTLISDFQCQILKELYLRNRRAINIEQKGVIHDHGGGLLVTKMRCKYLPDSDRGDFRCRRAVDSSGLLYKLRTLL